jgi:hypothetical protein
MEEVRDEQEKPVSFFRECSEAIRKRIEYSTIIGLSCIVLTQSKLVKTIWYLGVLTGAALTIYLIVINVKSYLQFNVVNQVQIVNEFPALLPVVTVCNLNYFTTPFSKDYLQNVSQILGMPDIFDTRLNYSGLDFLIDYYADAGKANVIESKLPDEEIQKLGYTIDQILIKCKFGNRGCDSSDFRWIFLPKYGNCFSFNSGFDSFGNKTDAKKVIAVGSDGGLTLELFVGVPTIMEKFTKAYGAIVFVHSPTTSLLSLSGVNVLPNAETNIIVSRHESQKLSSPYSQCDILQSKDSSLYDLVKSKGYAYRQADCIYRLLIVFPKYLFE